MITLASVRFFSQISSIILALLFILTINLKSIITINYFVNQSEIIELFCINKEKPKLNCHGKCHLAKELVKVEDQDHFPFSQKKSEQSTELIYDLLADQLHLINTIVDLENSWIIYSESTISQPTSVLAPPPRA